MCAMVAGIKMLPMEKTVELGAEEYTMRFDNLTMAYAEQVYAAEYARAVNIAEIAMELVGGDMSAAMAVAYAAIKSGGTQMGWLKFCREVYTWDNSAVILPVVQDFIIKLIAPESAAAHGGEKTGDTKNRHSRG